MSMTHVEIAGNSHPTAKPPRRKPPSPWRNGRLFVEVTEEHIRKGLERDSSHCIIALALADAGAGNFRHISVDLQSCRLTDSKRKLRLTFLSPHAVRDLVVATDQGWRDQIRPCTFSMKPAIIAQSGKKRATPSPEQLKGSGLKVAAEQPHVSNWQERHRAASALVVAGTHAGEAAQAAQPRKKRQPRALVSSVKNGEVPVQLGGRPPPVSILSRREFGMRAIRR
jgi:hypothetical protein